MTSFGSNMCNTIKLVNAILLTPFVHFMSLSHTGNSHKISNFFCFYYVEIEPINSHTVAPKMCKLKEVTENYSSLKMQMMISIFSNNCNFTAHCFAYQKKKIRK